jgi:hypothetical protein
MLGQRGNSPAFSGLGGQHGCLDASGLQVSVLKPSRPGRGALTESVDYWTMSKLILKTLGGKPDPDIRLERDWELVSSS